MRARSRSDLTWRSWEGEHAIFDPASGDTHLLDEVAAVALRCLAPEPLSEEGLAAQVSVALDVPVDDDLRRYVHRVVRYFDQLGLIDRT